MTAKITQAAQFIVHFLNRPLVKETIKNTVGSVTFAFGIVELYDLYQIARGREISTEQDASSPKWVQVATKVAIVSAKISLILSAAASRPGIFLISTLVGSFFSTAQLEQVFGPNTIFAINPWHPRHVISIAAVVFALPVIAESIYRGIRWTAENGRPWLTDAKVRLMALFNTLTSRPVQHLGNQFCRWAFF